MLAPRNTSSNASITTRKPNSQLPKIELGSVATIQGKGFGNQPGGVFVRIESMVLETELLEWNDSLAEAELPRMPIVEPTRATVFVIASNDNVVESLEVMLLPPALEQVAEVSRQASISQTASAPATISSKSSVRPAPPKPATVVYSGQELTLDGELSEKPGSISLVINDMKFPVKLNDWNTQSATITLPEIETEGVHASELVIRHDNGKIVDRIAVNFASNQN